MGTRDDTPSSYDIDALQKELSSLPEVRAVRVVATSGGRVSEVHLVAEGTKAPKQLVRDVQTIAAAQFGLDIDHRVVSIVHFADEEFPDTASVGPSLASVTWTSGPANATCRVELDVGEHRHSGEASGSAAHQARLAAQATISALQAASPRPGHVEVADLTIATVGGRRVAVVMLVTPAGDAEEIVVGSALVRTDDADAAARATLAAFARRPA